MAETERTRVRERGPLKEDSYERIMRDRKEFLERQRTGPVVIKPADRPMQVTRQGRIIYFLEPLSYPETPLQGWQVFKNDILTHSGKHKHQGGFAIYVIEGKGYSIVDGERWDWQKGDLLLLPIRPGGVVHQHFNTEPGKPCIWIAFVPIPIIDHLALGMTQVETSPDYKGS